jgi:hypothetical protein
MNAPTSRALGLRVAWPWVEALAVATLAFGIVQLVTSPTVLLAVGLLSFLGAVVLSHWVMVAQFDRTYPDAVSSRRRRNVDL